jgi:membrane protein DedA with SNARE-associated domain
VVRTFISLPAGVARMNFAKFTLYTILGCLPWSLALAFAGFKLGENWHAVDRIMRPFSLLLAVAFVVAAAWWIRRRLRQARAVDGNGELPDRGDGSPPEPRPTSSTKA